MNKVPIIYKNVNLEVLTKLLNSVAKRYGCAVEYVAEDNRIAFTGDADCCRHVTEETLSFFPKTTGRDGFPIQCPVDKSRHRNY